MYTILRSTVYIVVLNIEKFARGLISYEGNNMLIPIIIYRRIHKYFMILIYLTNYIKYLYLFWSGYTVKQN